MADNVIEFRIFGKDDFSKTFSKISSAAKVTAKVAAVAGTAIATGMGLASKAIIDVGSTTENLRIRMSAMLGSAKEGNAVFQDMASFASKVPFEYEKIMDSATTLSGVLRGGRQEINQFMPVIADLAAVSGLSIQDTTNQIVRMYSAGAGAADLFRERGINAMLGFQAGVSYSAEETTKKLIEAFESPASKFRGASMKLATTWDGIVSMMGDKWFQFKSQIADSGLFNYFKSIAIVIDRMMGQALEDSANNAAKWSNWFIQSIENVAAAGGFLADMFRGLHVVFLGMQTIFAKVAESILENIFSLADGVRRFANLVPGVDIGPMENFASAVNLANLRTQELKGEFQDLATQQMPSESVNRFMEEVRMVKTELDAVGQTLQENVIQPMQEQFTNGIDIIRDKFLTFMQELNDNTLTFATGLVDLMSTTIDSVSKGIATAIVEGASLADTFKNIAKQVLTQLLTMFIKMGVQRLVLAALNKTATGSEAASELAKASATTYANAFSSTAAIPIVGPALAPAVAAASTAAMTAGATASAASGAALGATVGARQYGGPVSMGSSYLVGEKGPEIFSPGQSGSIIPNNQLAGNGGGVNIENLVIHVMENATTGDVIASMDKTELRENIAMPIIEALDDLYVHGVAPKFIEEKRQ